MGPIRPWCSGTYLDVLITIGGAKKRRSLTRLGMKGAVNLPWDSEIRAEIEHARRPPGPRGTLADPKIGQ